MEQISAGFSLEHRADGIIIYHLHDIRRETIDVVFGVSTGHDQEYFRAEKHLRRILMIQADTLIPTPYALHRLIEAEKLTPRELRESFALVVTNTLTFRMMSLFLNRNMPAYTRSITKIFQSQTEAVAWLSQRLADLGE